MGLQVKALSNRAVFAGGNQLSSEFFYNRFLDIVCSFKQRRISDKDTPKIRRKSDQIKSKRLSDTNLNRRQGAEPVAASRQLAGSGASARAVVYQESENAQR